MVQLVFVLDTSGSMNQRTDKGITYLDVAKNSIETFLTKLRSRDRNRQDRLVLITYAQGAGSIKVDKFHPGFVNQQLFLKQLGNVEATDLGRPGETLKTAFELVNMDRLQNFIDTFAQGRNPCYAEHTVIIVFTDSGASLVSGDVTRSLALPLEPKPGSELVKEPFRWDQRLYGVSLRMSGTHGIGPSGAESPYKDMCEVTGGKLFVANSKQALHQVLESLNSKIHPGVVITLEPLPGLRAGQSQMPSAQHKMILTKPQQKGHWPIPDEFWPNTLEHQIPARNAHPIIHFSQEESEPQVVENMPFDKYELEPCALTQHILSLKRTNICWQCFVQNSHNQEGPGKPFGYLKPSSAGNTVNLILMPYDYPALLELVRGLFSFPKVPPSKDWQQRFDQYLTSIPPYYIQPIKVGLLTKYGPAGGHLIPEHISGNLKTSLSNYLVKLKGLSKVHSDKTNTEIGKVREAAKQDQAMKDSNDRGDPSLQAGKAMAGGGQGARHGKGRQADLGSKRPDLFMNALDIVRDDLISQLAKMKENVRRLVEPSRFRPLIQREEQLHTVPIASMGNYQEAIKNKVVVRDPESDEPQRPLTFGNPFKLPKHVRVDEAEAGLDAHPNAQGMEHLGGEMPGNLPGRNRRRNRSESPAPVLKEPGGPPEFKRRRGSSGPGPGHPGHDTGRNSRPHQQLHQPFPGGGPPPGAKSGPGGQHLPHGQHGQQARPPGAGTAGNGSGAWQGIPPALKVQCIKEVRRPGRNYDTLLSLVQSVGVKEERRKLVEELTAECKRHRKVDLILKLQALS